MQNFSILIAPLVRNKKVAVIESSYANLLLKIESWRWYLAGFYFDSI